MWLRKPSFSFCCMVALAVAFSAPVRPQERSLKIQTFLPTPDGYLNLLKPLKEIRENTVLNESIVDLASVYLTDSILPRKFERHQLPVIGGFTRMAGFRWLSINGRKEKYVGTAKNGFRIPGGVHFTEYDVNINLVPHLKRYIDLSYAAYTRQKKIGRYKKENNHYTGPPFVYPDEETDLSVYHVHCELTPPAPYREMIDDLFYPIIPGSSAAQHLHFGDENFTAGLYGAYVSDCNHDCHPEIHPYEWLWWLNVHPSLDEEENSKTWLLGLFREGSNRMPRWSPAPRTGEIAIPFIFPAGSKELVIELQHLVYGRFNEEGFRQLANIPADAKQFDATEEKFLLEEKNTGIVLKTNAVVKSPALKYWFSPLNYDEQRELISGQLHIAVSNDDLYTAKVKFSY